MDAPSGGAGEADATAARKRDHLELAVQPESQSAADPGWDDVALIPRAVPEVSLADVDLTTELLGHRLAAPVVVAGMTGGHPDATRINAALGAAAEHLGLAVGVGSQRAALGRSDLADTFAVLRRNAPSAMVLANIGCGQLVAQGETPPLSAADLDAIVAMVKADALSIHLNAAQELVQPEGDRFTGPLVPAIAEVVATCGVPVVAKQTGSGMTRVDAVLLVEAGVAALDVGGAGGTSFTRIEAVRAERADDDRGRRLGRVFADWGAPTAVSVLETRGAGVPVIATGGVRHGLDAARALALGGTAVGIGRVAILAAQQGTDALIAELEGFLAELRTALVLCGARTPGELRATPPVLTGDTQAWSQQRHLLH